MGYTYTEWRRATDESNAGYAASDVVRDWGIERDALLARIKELEREKSQAIGPAMDTLNKGDRGWFQVVLIPEVISRYPKKYRTYTRRAFGTRQQGWFLGWSTRVEGRIEWESDEVGNVFFPEKRIKVAIVALDDGIRAFRKLYAVLPENLEAV